MLLELLDKVNEKMKDFNYSPILQYCFNLSGEIVKSILGIHQQCRVLIVSPDKEFKGLKSFSKFGTKYRPSLPVDSIKPKPSTWVQTATVSWLNKNDTVDVPNSGINYSHFKGQDSLERTEGLKQAALVSSLRDQHTKVHMQDQRLLTALNQSQEVSKFIEEEDLGDSEDAFTARKKYDKKLQDPSKNEDRTALLTKKSFAVVTRDDIYDWWPVEEDFI